MAQSQNHQQYQQRVREQLQDWSVKIDLLRASITERTSRKECQFENLEALLSSQAELRHQLAVLEQAGPEQWAAERDRLEQLLARFHHDHNALLESATQRPASSSPEESPWHA